MKKWHKTTAFYIFTISKFWGDFDYKFNIIKLYALKKQNVKVNLRLKKII